MYAGPLFKFGLVWSVSRVTLPQRYAQNFQTQQTVNDCECRFGFIQATKVNPGIRFNPALRIIPQSVFLVGVLDAACCIIQETGFTYVFRLGLDFYVRIPQVSNLKG